MLFPPLRIFIVSLIKILSCLFFLTAHFQLLFHFSYHHFFLGFLQNFVFLFFNLIVVPILYYFSIAYFFEPHKRTMLKQYRSLFAKQDFFELAGRKVGWKKVFVRRPKSKVFLFHTFSFYLFYYYNGKTFDD